MPEAVIRHTKTMVEKGLVSLSIFNGVKPNSFEWSAGEIVTICGDKGIGKTTLAAVMATREMLPPIAYWKVREARKEANYIRKYKGCKEAVVPRNVKHLVYSEFPLATCSDQGYLKRPAYKFDLDRMLLPDGVNDAQFFPYGALLVSDEFMAKFAARGYTQGEVMPMASCKFLQVMRHRGIRILTTSLTPTGADKGLRDMSQTYFLIIHRIDDTYRNLPRKTWFVLSFDNDKSCAKFKDNPRRTDIAYVPYIFMHNGDIHKSVDSEGENVRFLVGMENRKIEFDTWEVA